MSLLFSPMRIGILELQNRFIVSATYEGMASDIGEVTDDLVKRYERLSKGGAALSITGYMYVHASGRALRKQTGIHADSMISGLTKLTDAVHNAGGKIAFQIAHSGRQTQRSLIGRTPMAPSSRGRDPLYFVKPREMTEDDIMEMINAFGAAAGRAVEAGADAVQLHAAHGYLINEFLSPYFKIRTDSWGGSGESRFRFLKSIVQEVKGVVPSGFPILAKLNTKDYTPEEGITPALAATYAGWLADLGIDAVEVSCGSVCYSYMNMCRGEVPTKELVQGLRWWEKPVGKVMISKLEGKYDLEEGYNLDAARLVKPAIGDTPLILVGGMRKVSHMEEILEKNFADFISMSRPFIREPFLVNRIREGKMEKVSCVSCNRCLAAVPNEFPVYCYNKAFPKR